MQDYVRYLATFMVITVAASMGLALLTHSAAHPRAVLLCGFGGAAVGFLVSEAICVRPRRRRIKSLFEEALPTALPGGEPDLIGDAPTLPVLTWSPLQLRHGFAEPLHVNGLVVRDFSLRHPYGYPSGMDFARPIGSGVSM